MSVSARLTLWIGAALLSVAPVANAGTVLSETWSGAPVGAVTVPGSLVTSARTWTTTFPQGSGTAPTFSIVDVSGDLKLENTVAGSPNDNEAVLTAPLSGMVAGKPVTIEFDIRDFTPASSSQQRFYVLVENSTSGDGYRVRFSSETNDEEVLNMTLYEEGVEAADEKFDDEVNGAGLFGVPNANGEWHVKMTFRTVGADTVINYEVTGLNGTPDLVAPATATYPGVVIDDVLNSVSVWCRRPLAAIDNVQISQDVEGPQITLLGAPVVQVSCGATYNDAGATALDNLDGNVSGIQVVNPVNTLVPGNYTVTYNVSDSAGNPADEVARTVEVLNDCPDIFITPTSETTLNRPEGASAEFSINAVASGPLDYAWFFDNGAKAVVSVGTNSNTLVIDPVTFADEGTYYCQVTDGVVTETSPVFTLNVTPPVPVASLPVLGLLVFGAAMGGALTLRRK